MSKNRNKRRFNNTNSTVSVNDSIKIESNTETLIEEKEEKNNIIRIKRTCKPGEVNVNKVMYNIDSYKEVMNKKIIPLVDKGLLSCEVFITKGNPYGSFNNERFMTIDPENSKSNRIVSICDDYIEVEFKDESTLNFIKENESSVTAQMRYFGDFDKYDTGVKVYKVTDIITFDIIIKRDYKLN